MNDNQKEIYVKLLLLTDDERLEIFNQFCKECGYLDPKCQCWNDE